jgi:hypothetical protein
MEEAWKAISPEGLAAMEPGSPVVIFSTEWKEGKRLTHYQEAKFVRYSQGRGIVTVESRGDFESEILVCDTNVGRWTVIQIEEMHLYSGYDS